MYFSVSHPVTPTITPQTQLHTLISTDHGFQPLHHPACFYLSALLLAEPLLLSDAQEVTSRTPQAPPHQREKGSESEVH